MSDAHGDMILFSGPDAVSGATVLGDSAGQFENEHRSYRDVVARNLREGLGDGSDAFSRELLSGFEPAFEAGSKISGSFIDTMYLGQDKVNTAAGTMAGSDQNAAAATRRRP